MSNGMAAWRENAYRRTLYTHALMAADLHHLITTLGPTSTARPRQRPPNAHSRLCCAAGLARFCSLTFTWVNREG